MGTDLVTASFDILANAMYRSEPPSTMFSLKSFLINKVPILLSQLSGSIFPMTPEMSITQALSHLDPNAFPAFSQGFDDIMGGTNSLSDVRQDFLNACALHGHITTTTVERLLGEPPIQGPPALRYEKKALLDQCKNNFDKANTYIDEMENLDGNAGAIAGAVTEVRIHLRLPWHHADMILVHHTPLRNPRNNASEANLQPTVKETAMPGRYAAVHIACEHLAAFVPVSR